MFLYSFSKISSHLIVIRCYTTIFARPLQENFQQLYKLISERLINFLKIFAKLPLGTYQKNMNREIDFDRLID